MPWRDDPPALAAWQRGQTGVPIVDAGMRQLWQTGWMHNRVRMIVASFLVKHLLIPGRMGEAWFWDTLVDADLASNSRQLAVGRRLRRRRRAVFPHLQPGAAGTEIRSGRRLCAPLRARTGPAGQQASSTRRGIAAE
jgi:deoxyribodipyrimidine photolyase